MTLSNTASKDCENCKNKCCTTEAVFLTKIDIVIIKQKKGLLEKDFIKQVEGYEKPIKLMKSQDGECIFYNKKTKKCDIYDFRPLDCQLFPLDIDFRNGKYYLIAYNHCDLRNWSLEEIQYAKSKIIPLLKPDIKEYAKFPMKLYDQKNGF